MSGGFCFAKELRHALCLQADNNFGLLAKQSATQNRRHFPTDKDLIYFYMFSPFFMMIKRNLLTGQILRHHRLENTLLLCYTVSAIAKDLVKSWRKYERKNLRHN